ncbi:MAG: Tex family protein [Chloroflexota bacterium]
MSTIRQKIAQELNVRVNQVESTVNLLDDDNTIPFIARYRKETTGGLDEEQLRAIQERLTQLRNLAERKETVLRTIDEQGKLTSELRAKIDAADTMQVLEDLYLPFRPKRRTRATIAKERGLEPLAKTLFMKQGQSGLNPAKLAESFVGDDVPDAEAALAGARDIIAEAIAEDADIRTNIRTVTNTTAWLDVKAHKDAPQKDERKIYEMYYDYREKLRDIPPHRLLAINRGEKDGVLKVKLDVETDRVLGRIESRFITHRRGPFMSQLQLAIADSYKRLLGPSIEREVRDLHTDDADEHAIQTFGLNMRSLLMQPPIKGRVVIGIDPGYRTGCKAAIVDETGKFLGGATIYPHAPQKQWDQAKQSLLKVMKEHNATILAIGNGTASRETEALAAEVVKAYGEGAYIIVNEAGASVYSASPLARQEFPDLDVSMRGAISIARRLQDPLAELVKIDPKSIGVGLYQHDVNQKRLEGTLDAVVESVVNNVGVDVNTASPALLKYVSGVSSKVANAIQAHRDEKGAFTQRGELKDVKGVGAKTYEQAVGFLKIPDSVNPFDNTFIHPESYRVVDRLLQTLGLDSDDPNLTNHISEVKQQSQSELKRLAEKLDVGPMTLNDILDNLAKPGRDPRDDLPAPILRQDVLKMEDLQPGMILKGVVRNVVDFGAFVDIGVKQDGLVHVSQLADRFVKNPFEVVNVGDVVQVKVMTVDTKRGRIGLSMKEIN